MVYMCVCVCTSLSVCFKNDGCICEYVLCVCVFNVYVC